MDSLVFNEEARALYHLVMSTPKWLLLVLPRSGQILPNCRILGSATPTRIAVAKCHINRCLSPTRLALGFFPIVSFVSANSSAARLVATIMAIRVSRAPLHHVCRARQYCKVNGEVSLPKLSISKALLISRHNETQHNTSQ